MLNTPRTLRRQADLYEQWATLLAAGVSMLRSLSTLRRNAFSRRLRKLLDRVIERVEDGASLPEALQPESRLIPPFDRALITTGDHGGRLESILKDLAHHHRTRAKWLGHALHASLYPLLVVTAGLLLFPVSLIVTMITEGDAMPYLLHKARIAAVIAAGVLALAGLRGCARRVPGVRLTLERIARVIPVLGPTLRDRALARFTLALETLLNAGMGAVDAWPVAADACGSHVLRHEVRRRAGQLASGNPISDTLTTSRVFPDLFTDAYRIGEMSGSMQDTLEHLQRHYEESAERYMEILAVWVPRILYVAGLVYVALSVLRFWQGYWAQFDSLL